MKGSSTPAARYKLCIVDRKVKVRRQPLAAFIVPIGREHEWLFSAIEGQDQLTDDAGFSRLAIVTMQRGHDYESLDEVKAELSSLIPQLLYQGAEPARPIPFLSLGEGIGSATMVHTGRSALSDEEFYVEDVEGADEDGHTLRRLIFASNRNLIQSEARLLPVAGKYKPAPSARRVDQTHLSNQHHHSIVAAFSILADLLMPPPKDLAKATAPAAAMVVGLGGGSLAMFLHEHFQTMCLTAVELDPAIVEVAEHWFGFTADRRRLAVHVADGAAPAVEAPTVAAWPELPAYRLPEPDAMRRRRN
jgi:hypothetical protein